jgi:hypothetical protein
MRFTLAACLALTAMIGVMCFLLTTKPSVASYLLMIAITLLAPVCAVGGILYGRDNLRAFCIGAALPLALLVWSSLPYLQGIQFDPVAYGWSPRAGSITVNSSVAPGPSVSVDSIPTLRPQGLLSEMPVVPAPPSASSMPTLRGPSSSGDGVSSTSRSVPVIWQTYVAWSLPTALQQTLDQAKAMTNPTCFLLIAAIVSGSLLMAIRGGLSRNDEIAGGQPVL